MTQNVQIMFVLPCKMLSKQNKNEKPLFKASGSVNFVKSLGRASSVILLPFIDIAI